MHELLEQSRRYHSRGGYEQAHVFLSSHWNKPAPEDKVRKAREVRLVIILFIIIVVCAASLHKPVAVSRSGRVMASLTNPLIARTRRDMALILRRDGETSDSRSPDPFVSFFLWLRALDRTLIPPTTDEL